MAELAPLVAEKIAVSRGAVALADQGKRQDMINSVVKGRGRSLMVSIDQVLDRMKTEEEKLLTLRSANAQWVVSLLSFGQALAVVLLFVVAALTVRDAGARFRAMSEARDEATAANAILRDEMAARAAAEGQVRQMQKMESIGQLTGGIAHDFNNMLAIVIGSLDLAKRRAAQGDAAKLDRCIDNAREGAERAAALTARLLAFSRQQPLAPVAIDANKLVSGMSELLRRTLGEHIEIETVLAGGLWRSYADPGQLENAILNLAVNARDAMPEGGRLTIESANAYLDDEYARDRAEVIPGQYVSICVSDTGSGMSADVIDRAFDPFFTTKGVGKGTGLGLSQVFGFVKQSGGHVAIYSEEGEGTTVKLYLPRFAGPLLESAEGKPDAAAELPEGRADEIVLVVEDEQRVRHFSVDALRELGYTAVSARNGAEALATLAEQPSIALLFTDVVMPEMNGRRLADEARKLRADLKILYTTGYTRNAVVHNGMLDAGVAFLPKPFTIAQLAWKVREVLDGGGANRPV
jgi:signal transduction histidine kinase/CheY-like chemotaxis protein